jgi:hypothetical protein
MCFNNNMWKCAPPLQTRVFEVAEHQAEHETLYINN